MDHIAQEKEWQGHDGFIHVPPVGLKSQTTRTEAIGQGYGEKSCSGQPAPMRTRQPQEETKEELGNGQGGNKP